MMRSENIVSYRITESDKLSLTRNDFFVVPPGVVCEVSHKTNLHEGVGEGVQLNIHEVPPSDERWYEERHIIVVGT